MGRKEKEVIPVEVMLTDEEKLKYGEELAETRNRAREAEGRKKAYNTSIKSELDSCEMRDAELSRKINTGKEFRDVECLIVRDWDAGTLERGNGYGQIPAKSSAKTSSPSTSARRSFG